ncbi:MAG: calcium-binding protein [Arenibacterium sp.]
MARVTGGGVALAPEVHEFFDVAELGNGRFAIIGSDGGFSSTADIVAWWFNSDGSQIGNAAIVASAGEWTNEPAIAAGDNLNVVSAHIVRGEWSILATPLSPTGSEPSQVAIPSDIGSLSFSPEVTTWGDGIAVLHPRSASISDNGVNLATLDQNGNFGPVSVLKTTNRVFPSNGDSPISAVEAQETKSGGLAVVGQTFGNGSGAIWLWTLDKNGAEKASFRVDLPGNDLNLIGAIDPTVEVLDRGDILVGWDGIIPGGFRNTQDVLEAQRVDENGAFLGNQFSIVVQPADNVNVFDLDVLALDTGGFLATWNEATDNGSNAAVSYSVKLREFDATGNPVGRVQTITDDAALTANPTLVSDDAGGATLLWLNNFTARVNLPPVFDPHVEAVSIETTWQPGAVLQGKKRADRIDGTGKDDLLVGKAGADILKGLKGDDDLRGGTGNDRLVGGAGRDILEGGGGKDRLFGGAGNDVIAGGAGNDVMKGGAGRDQFIFREAKGTDRILGFNPDKDLIYLQNALFGDEFAPATPRVREIDGDTIIDYTVDGLDAKIILSGVTNMAFDDTFTFGPIITVL